MNKRKCQIKYDQLNILTNMVIEKITANNTDNNHGYYFVIGNPGLRIRKKNNNASYLFNNHATEIICNLSAPLYHQVNEQITFCECPDFGDVIATKEGELSRAMSLEVALQMTAKIKGFVIIIDYNDFYTSRGAAYKELILRLGQLFNSDFEKLLDSAVFLVTNKECRFTQELWLKQCGVKLSDLNEELAPFEEYDASDNKFVQQAKMEMQFLTSLLKHPNHFMVLDENDNGECRNSLFQTLTQLKPFTETTLAFDALYRPLMKGYDFNLRKFIDDKLIEAHLQEPIAKISLKHTG
jgi:hypothetical protein